MTDEWVPHHPETWPFRVARLLRDVTFRDWHGHDAVPEFTDRLETAGTMVKIVMVSRLGDVGITTDLLAENGYQARVLLSDLEEALAPHPDREGSAC